MRIRKGDASPMQESAPVGEVPWRPRAATEMRQVGSGDMLGGLAQVRGAPWRPPLRIGSGLSPLAVPSAALGARLSALTFPARKRGSERASRLPGVTQLMRELAVPGDWVSLSPL